MRHTYLNYGRFSSFKLRVSGELFDRHSLQARLFPNNVTHQYKSCVLTTCLAKNVLNCLRFSESLFIQSMLFDGPSIGPRRIAVQLVPMKSP